MFCTGYQFQKTLIMLSILSKSGSFADALDMNLSQISLKDMLKYFILASWFIPSTAPWRPERCCSVLQRILCGWSSGNFEITCCSSSNYAQGNRCRCLHENHESVFHCGLQRTYQICDSLTVYVEKQITVIGEILTSLVASGVATGGLEGHVPPLVPRTDCGIRPDPMRSW